MRHVFSFRKPAHRVWAFMGLLVFLIAFPHISDATSGDSILCENSNPGSVEELPPLTQDWVVILCTPSGQALAPMVKDKPVFWFTHENKIPFLLQAYPLGKTLPVGVNAEHIRFTHFAAREIQGEQKYKTLKMWELGFDSPPPEGINRIYQLDARSSYRGIIFNLFFYLRNDKPEWLIVCLSRCQRSVSINITYH